MESIRELYRIGVGPSSSHTMGPRRAAERFPAQYGAAAQYRVTLFGSLAATGKGHLTDAVLHQYFAGRSLNIVWAPDEQLPLHANGMRFEALDEAGKALVSWQVYSVGGGAIRAEDETAPAGAVYDLHNMADILARCEETGQALWEYVETCEGPAIWGFLCQIWRAMREAVQRGLQAEGVLPGGLGLARKAWAFRRKAGMGGPHFQRTGLLSAYALAVAEENAAGGVIVTAPTCGSCGVVPAVLRYVEETLECSEDAILRALATAGLIGNLVKANASISGAEVGCGGEVGTACAMAAGAATQLLAGTVRQIEYAAETALEHHLGLTCDPVAGLVQIPCIVVAGRFATLLNLDVVGAARVEVARPGQAASIAVTRAPPDRLHVIAGSPLGHLRRRPHAEGGAGIRPHVHVDMNLRLVAAVLEGIPLALADIDLLP